MRGLSRIFPTRRKERFALSLKALTKKKKKYTYYLERANKTKSKKTFFVPYSTLSLTPEGGLYDPLPPVAASSAVVRGHPHLQRHLLTELLGIVVIGAVPSISSDRGRSREATSERRRKIYYICRYNITLPAWGSRS